MKRVLALAVQFVALSILTFLEDMFVYTEVIMRTESRIAAWLCIVLGSALIAGVNYLILRGLRDKVGLPLNTGLVYVLSAAVAVLLCVMIGLLFDRSSLLDNSDRESRMNYMMLVFFALWTVFFSAVTGFFAKKAQEK